MKHDELIDDVARQMTAVDGRPALRERVLAGIEATPIATTRPWLIPVTAGSVFAAVVLTSMLATDGSDRDPAPELIARHDLVLAVEMNDRSERSEAPAPTPIEVPDVPSIARIAAAQASVTAIADQAVSDIDSIDAEFETILADFPMLPPLPEPDPIVVAAITFDDMTIEPINIATVQITALTVEPLPVSATNPWPSPTHR